MKKREAHAGREGLLRAAADEFARVGFAGASVGEIARRAGVTQPLVNHHFGTKKGLWTAVVEALFAELEAELREHALRYADAPARERLRQLLRNYVLFCGTHPQLTRMLRIESGSELGLEVHRRWQGRFVELFEGQLLSAIECGAIAPLDPHFLFFVIVGASTEVFAQPELARVSFDLDVTDPAVVERAADFVCAFVLRGATLDR